MRNIFRTLLLSLLLLPVTARAQYSVGNLKGEFGVSPLGGATYTVPIETPPGPGGSAPQIVLSYNSQGGNGPVGVGFGLSGTSVITRSGRDIHHDGYSQGLKFDSSDAICLDGTRLVLTSGAIGGAASGYAYGYIIDGKEFAKQSALSGAISGAAIGGASGAVEGFAIKKQNSKIESFQEKTWPSENHLPTGHRGNELVTQTNSERIIDNIVYSGHALDRMQGRGIMPSVVKDTLLNPISIKNGNTPDTKLFIGLEVKVIINDKGKVITVIPK